MIYIGSDHRGYELKGKIKNWLSEQGFECEDLGPAEFNKDDDYPDFAKAVAEKVASSEGSRGILICGSGVGVAIAANKIKGIRAGTILSPEQVKASVNDEDLNVLALSADYVDEEINQEIIKAYLDSNFSGEERHVRRLNKIKEMENTF
ncbi:MAG: ribose-5-phosphate isomerase [Candidatus Yanofskybacteria bacterium CG10_big_fil_rev_8_21_14_0_10_36_16]|uniref:Ribose-5-phosphate isomerase n=1 Tax=Candidatus Yanofskybacteria bacterium CG10_big_fil_rev_8_21_14_0_10_36_16 TaxID=1975096 RepID=A0A2J0Q8E5_9BACT|nr:MAG: ribose-5-phosphate isomerase [Candidatus Yanofskybacteria bacterium CG10_big_fil_rev_8_21_14_0_10_36_16]